MDSLTEPNRRYTEKQSLLLTRLSKYIWWQDCETAVVDENRLIAQVMDLGTWEDCLELKEVFGYDVLADVLINSQPGWFHPNSWAFWHYALRLIPDSEDPPSMPQRPFIENLN